MSSDFRNFLLHPEQRAVMVETFGANCQYNDFIKWRARNALGKIIDDGRHPNGFELEMRLYQNYGDKAVVPALADEVFYLKGSPSFKVDYLYMLPQEIKRRRISRL